MPVEVVDYRHKLLRQEARLLGSSPTTEKFLTFLKDFDHGLFSALDKTAALLLGDKIIAMPSDTVYGIFSVLSLENAQRLTAIRKRSEQKPFLVVIGSQYNFANLAGGKTDQDVISSFWPGKNTLIFQKNTALTYPLGETIALRQPSFLDNPLFYTLLNMIDRPLLAPSLNLPGQEPLFEKEAILEQFGDSLELLLYAEDFSEEIKNIPPSAIYDVTVSPIKKLR